MKKKWMQRTALPLVFCLIAVWMAGCQKDPGNNAGSPSYAGEGKLFTEPTELSIVISSHVSWPYNENWKMWQYFREATGANLQVTALSDSEYSTKVALMMATPEDLPDLLYTTEKTTVDTYAGTGAFLSYSDHMDLLPNYQAFWNTVPEEERKELFMQRTSGDGKIYSAPAYGTQTVNGIRTWMYRKDVFDKNGIQVPKTSNDLYEAAKKLKELYPESYPICFRTGFGKLDEWGPAWQNDFQQNAYYDTEEKTWKYGGREPVMKDMVEYFMKLRQEDLVPPDYLTMQTKSWEELMSTDRGFITLDYIVRIDFFNLANRENNPDYTLALMAPPIPDVPGGSAKLMKANLDFNGYCVCNTGREKSQENAFRLVDWMYTDEACDLLSWGKEGETYEVDANGKKKFILQEGEMPQNAYGVTLAGLYQRLWPEANEATYTEEQVAACHEVMQYLETNSNVTWWIPLTDDEAKRVADLKTELTSFMEEQLSKFLLLQRPISEWDQFQKDLDDMGVDELLGIYTAAYDRLEKNVQ